VLFIGFLRSSWSEARRRGGVGCVKVDLGNVSVTSECENCGAELVGRSGHCRECGYGGDYAAAEEAEVTDFSDDFDYDEFVAREFPDASDPAKAPERRRAWIRLIAAIVVLSLLLPLLTMLFRELGF